MHQEISWFDDSANSRSHVNMTFTANWILALIIVAMSPLIFIQRFLQMKFLKGFNGDAKVSLTCNFVNSINEIMHYGHHENILSAV